MNKFLLIPVIIALIIPSALLTSCGKAKKSDELSVCLSSEPATLDPAKSSTVDAATMISHLFSGLARWAPDESGKVKLMPDCALELPEGSVNPDGTVSYVYTLRDGLFWSDGKEVFASDFEFAWNRAASTSLASEYGYLFEIVKGYDEIWEQVPSSAKNGKVIYEFKNPDAKLDVKADDEKKTLTVTLKNAVPYWNELLAFPTFMPMRADVTKNESWATEAKTYVCNGPYVMAEWVHDSLITLEKSMNYYGNADVTMQRLHFYLSDDANNMLANFERGSWQLIDSVPNNEIRALEKSYPDEFIVAGQLGTYYSCFNINRSVLPPDTKLIGREKALAEAEVRRALSLLLDRNYIAEEIGQAGQKPASSFIPMGLSDADGKEFYMNANLSEDGTYGYYKTDREALEDNYSKAIDTLKKYYSYDEKTKKFTDAPTITYLYNTSDAHRAIGEYLQSKFAGIGITLKLENQEWATFLNSRKNGDYDLARNGWVADFNDPITFLDMWVSESGNNDIGFGTGEHASLRIYDLDLTMLGYSVKIGNETWRNTYDRLIKIIKEETDIEKRYKLMHVAEDMLMETGCIVPLYYYTDVYMIDNSVEGFFTNPLGYKFFMFCTVR